ncbi:hypothetical protein ACFWJT_00955, partial [Streptomyces sp. NPDC127069]|uniref:hypothetical protein n=1 Tax=Streptomyces sp. NPDC127069 TaxID=3347128 RepID=UPI003647B59A
AYVLDLCGSGVGQGVLVGGYHGRWLEPGAAPAPHQSRPVPPPLGRGGGPMFVSLAVERPQMWRERFCTEGRSP